MLDMPQETLLILFNDNNIYSLEERQADTGQEVVSEFHLDLVTPFSRGH